MTTTTDFEDIDWSLLGKTRPLHFDDLRKFSSADLDPYTVQLAQALCEPFALSSAGLRNVSSVLSPLTEGTYHRDTFNFGFGAYHPLRVILKSDSGFVLLAIVGSLSEYYSENFIVEFFRLLAKKRKVPETLVPIESQWRRMVSALYGVLAASDLGKVLATFEQSCPANTEAPKAETILEALDKMSSLARHKGTSVELFAGPDAVWIASAASWLYDLKYHIKTEDDHSIYKGPNVDQPQDAKITIITSSSSAQTVEASQLHRDLESLHMSKKTETTGGRVQFSDMFRHCFPDPFTDLERNTVAKYLRCASQILDDSLKSQGIDPRDVFLSQTSDKTGAPTHDLVKTLTAWFPEVHFMMDRAKQPKGQLDLEDARKLFDEQVDLLQKQCICPFCRGETNSSSSEICKISLVETIVLLGLNIAQMVVTPKTLPKARRSHRILPSSS